MGDRLGWVSVCIGSVELGRFACKCTDTWSVIDLELTILSDHVYMSINSLCSSGNNHRRKKKKAQVKSVK